MSREGVARQKPGPSKEALSKRERVLQAFSGGEVDKRPVTFWHSFGLAHMKAESLTAAALTFAAVYGVDLLRMPTVHDLPLPNQSSLDRAHDLTTIEPMSARAGFWAERIEALKSIVKLADKRIAVFEAIADPLTALSWVCPPEILVTAQRSHPAYLEKALTVISESQIAYLRALIAEAKIDGLVLEVGSASFEAREPAEFQTVVKPHLKSLLDDVRSQSDIPIWLQVSGKRVYFEPLLGLPHDMLSWSHLAHGPTLEKLPKSYRGPVAGGLNELALEKLSYQDIRRQVDEARNMPVKLICPGDALPVDLAPSKIAGLANFLSKRDRQPETTPTTGSQERIIDEP